MVFLDNFYRFADIRVFQKTTRCSVNINSLHIMELTISSKQGKRIAKKVFLSWRSLPFRCKEFDFVNQFRYSRKLTFLQH